VCAAYAIEGAVIAAAAAAAAAGAEARVFKEFNCQRLSSGTGVKYTVGQHIRRVTVT